MMFTMKHFKSVKSHLHAMSKAVICNVKNILSSLLVN